jgi:hypothetical protein
MGSHVCPNLAEWFVRSSESSYTDRFRQKKARKILKCQSVRKISRHMKTVRNKETIPYWQTWSRLWCYSHNDSQISCLGRRFKLKWNLLVESRKFFVLLNTLNNMEIFLWRESSFGFQIISGHLSWKRWPPTTRASKSNWLATSTEFVPDPLSSLVLPRWKTISKEQFIGLWRNLWNLSFPLLNQLIPIASNRA